jgi:hypothetical protein
VVLLVADGHAPAGVACAAALMSSVYEDHKDEDGFLYITYSGENTFGSSNADACSGLLSLC